MHNQTIDILAALLRITNHRHEHFSVFQRGKTGDFAHVKVIGPSLKASKAKNAHIAVDRSTGELCVSAKLSGVAGVVKRQQTGPKLGRFTYRVDPTAMGHAGRSLATIVEELVDELRRQQLW